jgi:hypothetical protein
MGPKSVPQPGFEAVPLPFYEAGSQPLDRFQRIETLSRLDGAFLSASLEEQTEVMGLQSVISTPAGAAKHMQEVVLHQNRANTNDPTRAAKKITRSYVEYAIDAQQRAGELVTLREALTDANPELLVNRVVDAQQPGVLAFLRYFDLSALRDGVKIDKIGYDPQKVDYSTGNGGIMVYADWAVESWRVHQVRKRLPEAATSEANRLSFWLERLVEIEKHYGMLKPIAREGLDTIYARSA